MLSILHTRFGFLYFIQFLAELGKSKHVMVLAASGFNLGPIFLTSCILFSSENIKIVKYFDRNARESVYEL